MPFIQQHGVGQFARANYDKRPIIESQPKQSKCKEIASKVGSFIKEAFSNYLDDWKFLFSSVKDAWDINKFAGVMGGIAVGSLALFHAVSVASLVAGAVFLAMGSGGSLLALGALLTVATFGGTALSFYVTQPSPYDYLDVIR